MGGHLFHSRAVLCLACYVKCELPLHSHMKNPLAACRILYSMHLQIRTSLLGHPVLCFLSAHNSVFCTPRCKHVPNYLQQVPCHCNLCLLCTASLFDSLVDILHSGIVLYGYCSRLNYGVSHPYLFFLCYCFSACGCTVTM